MRSLFGLGLLLLLAMTATTLPALSIQLARNVSLSSLVTSAPSTQSLRAGWFGVGLPAVNAEERRVILTQYAEHAEQPVCTGWVSDALGNAGALRGHTPVRSTQLDVLLSARAMECREQTAEALQVIKAAPEADALEGAQIGLLLSEGQRPAAERILHETVCPPLATWCEGYVEALLDTWHGAPQRSTFFPPADSPLRPAAGRLAPLSISAIPGVSIGQEHPLIVDDALPRDEGDNYIAFTNTPLPTEGGEIVMHVLGEVLNTNAASCLVLRLVYFDHNQEYLNETAEPIEIKGAFRLDHREQAPDAAAYVTPRITFDSGCLSGATAIGIYTVDMEMEASR